jgi:hypothetical protein
MAFLALSVYVLIQAIRTLSMRMHPAASIPGIACLAAALAAMLLLSWAKGGPANSWITQCS